LRHFVPLLAAVGFLVAGVPTQAGAAFPGSNGRIAYELQAILHWVSPDGTAAGGLGGDGANDYGPAWSADGKSYVYETSIDGQTDIYSETTSGTKKRLTVNASGINNAEPTWSPDCKRVAYNRTSGSST